MNKEECYNQGMEYFAQDRLEDAIAAYLRALDEDPNYADAFCNRGITKLKLGDSSGGNDDIAKARQLGKLC